MTYLTQAAVRPLHHWLSEAAFRRLLQVAKLLERVAMFMAIIMGMMIIAQFLYPSTRSLPNQYLGSTKLGGLSAQQLSVLLAAANDRPFSLKVGTTDYSLTPRQAGIPIDARATASALTSYRWQDRLTPFSLFQKRTVKTIIAKDTTEFDALSRQLNEEHRVAAINATVSKQTDQTYQIKPETPGLQVRESDIQRAFNAFDPYNDRALAITPARIMPAVTQDMLQSAVASISATKLRPPVTTYDGTNYAPTSGEIAEWASIGHADGQPDYDLAAIRNWLTTRLPSPARQSGKGLDFDATAEALRGALLSHAPAFEISFVQLLPNGQPLRHYDATNAGLAQLITDWKQAYPNLQGSVMLQEIGGQNRQASLDAGGQFKTASIYKLFLVWYLYNHIETGDIDPASPAVNGKTIAGCIEAMVVLSDNTCGETLGYRYGWRTLDRFVSDNGIIGTELNTYPQTASAAATAELMMRLSKGELLNKAHTDELLSYMQRQVYRSGIPAGAGTASVVDKVGTDAGIWNDAAVVHGPKTSYVLVVYTNGNSAAIKDLTTRLQSVLQR